jgi:hypothetical protein
MANSRDSAATVAVPAAYHLGRDGLVLQPPFDVAVVMPTVLRPSFARAVRSVFAQAGVGRVHLLMGVDKALGDRAVLETLRAEVPDGVLVTVLDPGYSTSRRHGGRHPAYDGGALRTVMSYLANAPYIAYLDDDNWWAPDHLADLLAAIRGKDWAFSLRWYVDPDSGAPLIVDAIESVGPGRGGYADTLGGWVDPNCLMIDATACEPVFRLWCHPYFDDETRMSADRRVFDALKASTNVGETARPTCFYTMNPDDAAHAKRLAWIDGRRQSGLNT